MIPLYPICGRCGWRKGGNDSWNGRACKCGHRAVPHTRCGTCDFAGLVDGKVCAGCQGSGLVPMPGAS